MRRSLLILSLLVASVVAPHGDQFAVLGRSVAKGTPPPAIVEVVGSPLASADDGTHHVANVTDGNFASYFVASTANGGWVGVDAGAAVTVRTVKFAPRRGDSAATTSVQFEDRVFGAKIQAADDAAFTTNLTDVYTFASAGPPSYRSNLWNTVGLTSPPTKRYWRWLSPTGGSANLAELRFIADAGATTAKPVQPVVSPYGGRYTTASTTVTITSLSGGQIYYTTDGSTPTTASTLYTGPFTLTIGTNTTLKAVAYSGALSTTTSDVATAFFAGYGFKPIEDWYNDLGVLVDCHGGGLLSGRGGVPLQINGYYYCYGNSANRYDNLAVSFNDGVGATGIWVEKSTDLLNWVFVGNILDVAGGHSWRYVVRPHVIYNESTSKYVLWGHAYIGPADSNDRAVVAQSSNPETGWTYQSTSLNPDGLGFKDDGLFVDDDGTGYTCYTDGTQTNVIISQLASDYLSAGIARVTAIAGGGREGCTLTKGLDGVYELYTSLSFPYGTTTGTDERAYFATSILGTWTTGRPMYASGTDPASTSFASQSTYAGRIGTCVLYIGDNWPDPLQGTRYIFLPVDEFMRFPTSWDLSRCTVPSNHLLTGLVAFWPLSEITSASDAAERVGSRTATLTGTASSQGIHVRGRSLSGSNHFTRASDSTLQTGNVNVWWNVWVNLSSVSGTTKIYQKTDDSTNAEYRLYVTGSQFVLGVNSTGNNTTGWTEITATTYGTIPTSTAIMVTGGYDQTNSQLWITVTDGTHTSGATDTTSYSSGIHAGTGNFLIGDGTASISGTVRQLGMWKAAKPDASTISTLYNTGLSLLYDHFSS